MSGDSLKRTPLFDVMVEMGGKMVDFSGWEMPLHFGAQIAEHVAVRKSAGLFDVSHMGRFFVKGTDARKLLLRLTPAKSDALMAGRAVYSLLLNEEGGIIDDLLIYTLATDYFLVVVNAATKEKDWAWMTGVRDRENFNVEMTDESEDLAMVALQGPMAAGIAAKILPDIPLENVFYYEHYFDELGGPLLIGRTGYTGEDGFELIAPGERAVKFWRDACAAGAVPCGLGSRDSLRLDMGYALYGSDIDEKTSPLEAGLKWTLDLERNDYIASDKIARELEAPPQRRLFRLKLTDKGIPRHGCPILVNGAAVGEVTSGGFSPGLRAGIAMGYINGTENIKAAQKPDADLAVEIRGKSVAAKRVKGSFVKGNTRPRK